MKDKVRVLFVENIAAEAAHRQVYRELAGRSEFEAHLLVPRAWRGAHNLVQCEPEVHPSLYLHTSPILFGYRQHRVLYRNLNRIIRRIRPHFVFLDQEPENYAAVQCIRALHRISPSTKLGIVSSRNIDHSKIGFPYRLRFTHRWCDAYVLRHPVDVCFVRTQAALQFMQPYARKLVHLPFPVDVDRFGAVAARQEAGEVRETVTIGYLGRLIEAKGVRLLLSSLPHLPGNIKMMFVGRGPLASDLKDDAGRLGVQERVVILPPVSHQQVPDVMARMDIIVVPSLETNVWKEQCPRVPIEAMASGVPVIGSMSGGIPEVLGDAGLYFKTGNLEDLVDKLRLLLNTPALRLQMKLQGRARAMANFATPVVAGTLARAILDSVDI